MSILRITKKTFTFEDFSPLLNGPLKVVLDQSIPKKVKNPRIKIKKCLKVKLNILRIFVNLKTL